ncbi:allatostatin-A receptor-like [Dendronephthya gigantea]|uniref:allatostatin-A receptor-like n=1 Tax=Dendronephthya gigantea TaxID=151771 RepID=UPI00106911ED|nr:allatostatin-A receptor-like [Dendronephthya gigantea]
MKRQVFVAIISFIAFFGNSLTVLLFIKKSKWLKKTYNCLILALAIQDILQAICILISPGYILQKGDYTLPSGETSRWIFCKIFWSHFCIFTLGITSVYTCLMLTLDRWLAVAMPLFYKKYEQSRKVVFSAVLFPWIAGMCLNVTEPLSTMPIKVNGTFICVWKTLEYLSETIVLAISTFLCTIVIPGALMVIAYGWIVVHTKRSQTRVAVIPAKGSNALKSLKRITTTAFFASSIVIICWLPSQLYYALSYLRLTKGGSTTHFFLIYLAFLNSCFNPVIYCFSNRTYRNGLRDLFSCNGCHHSHPLASNF